jgi:hypothetical protein
MTAGCGEWFGNNRRHAPLVLAGLDVDLAGSDQFLPVLLIDLHVHVPIGLRKANAFQHKSFQLRAAIGPRLMA